MIENDDREVVESVPSKQFNCTITLSSSIGPDHSALSVSWRHDNQAVSSGLVRLVTAGTIVDTFTSVITLSSVAMSDAGRYCCSAQLAGETAPLTHCITITVTSKTLYHYYTLLPTNIGLTVTGQYQNLRVGSSAAINCTAPAVLTDRTLTWSDPNGVTMVTSTTRTALLTLSPVDYTMRGSYMCTLTSSQLVSNRVETIAVTVDGKLAEQDCVTY